VARILGRVNPVVLDADGLNNLAAMGGLRDAIHAPLVMTPHPGEYARLATAMGLVCDPLEPGRRPDAAVELARACQAVVVLKGRHSIVTDGRRVYVNSTGNPALATAGSGDVLTGTVAGLIAQGLRPLDAAVLAVHLHGAAADRWAAAHGPAGLAARDLASLLPDALHHHRVAHP
jgi:NAD(P)H-hydrate epimerase